MRWPELFDQAISFAGVQLPLDPASGRYGFHPDHSPRPVGRCGDIRFLFGIDARPNLVAFAQQLPESAFGVWSVPRLRSRPLRGNGPSSTSSGLLRNEASRRYTARGGGRRVQLSASGLQASLSRHRTPQAAGDGSGPMRLLERSHFFFITNDCEMTAAEVVHSANGRWNQETDRAAQGGRTRSHHAG